MRYALVCLVAVSLLIACKNDEKEKPKELEMLDTQMAEIVHEEIKDLTKKDSLTVIALWKKVCSAFEKDDTAGIRRLSTPVAYCPVYLEKYNYFHSTVPAPLHFLLSAPSRKNYIARFAADLYRLNPRIYLTRIYPSYRKDLLLDSTTPAFLYTISFRTTEKSMGYSIWKEHDFKFLESRGSFRFCGLDVSENGSRYNFDAAFDRSLYFPTILDTFSNRWYSLSLKDMQEKRLYDYTGGDEIYRFTWLRSFHNPVVIRMQKQQGSFRLIVKEMIDCNGYVPQIMKVDTIYRISVGEWGIFKMKLEGMNFWNEPSREPETNMSTDGSMWIMEGYRNGQYHFTERHEHDGKYRMPGEYLISISRLHIPKDDIY